MGIGNSLNVRIQAGDAEMDLNNKNKAHQV